MIPTRLKLSNFTSYTENPPELDFTKFKLAAISGLNGAGKSSILDSITWCIWGQSRAGDSADSLIHSGTENMFVEFSFQLSEHIFTVKRLRSKKSGGHTSLEFWSGSHNLTEGTIKATQEKIISNLHLTFETFSNSSYLRQGHADEFTTKGPNDRKRILTDILGLDHYDKLGEKAKEKIKQLQADLTLRKYQLLELEAELSRKDESKQKKESAEKKINELDLLMITLEEDLKVLQEQRASLVAVSEQQNKLKQTLKDLQTELADILFQGKARAERISKLKQELLELPSIEEKLKESKSLERQRDEYNSFSQRKLEFESQLNTLLGNLNLKNNQIENLKKELADITSHINNLDQKSTKCPTCGQDINPEQKQKVKNDYLSEQKRVSLDISKIKTQDEQLQIKKLESEINSIKLDSNRHQEVLKKIREISLLQEKREKLIAAQATFESENKIVLELRTLFKNKKSQVEKLEIEVTKLPEHDNNLSDLNISISKKEAALSSLKSEDREARNLLGQATELISRVEQLEKEVIKKQDEKRKLQKEKTIFEELSLAFGKKGIQAMIIEAAIPEIEDETNKLLDKLTEGRMKVSLITQRQTKTKMADGEKGIIETLDIIISDEMGQRPYEMYSGGEAFRVNFAIRLAISKLLTHRAGAKLQFLVIDEGFGSQDAPGRAKLVEAIDAIKDDFEKILIITHIEELKEEFPVRIEVSKNNVGSTFEVIGA